jgi:trigger factor
MEIFVKDKSSFQKEIEVTISPMEMEPYVQRAIQKLGASLSLKGFRPGKAPLQVVKEAVGDAKIWEEAAEQAVQKSFFHACTENNLEIVSPPQVEVRKLAPGNELIYHATVEIVPHMQLSDWRGIAEQVRKKEQKEVQVEEKEVQDSLQWLADSRTKLIAVNRAAQSGDYVEITYEGRIADVKQEGLEGKRDGFILGKGGVLPEFEEKIPGMKQGETKEFSAVFPADHVIAHARGKEVQFRVTLESIQERQVPTLDDAFVEGLGTFKTLEELTQSVREGIQTEKEKKEQERVFLAVLDAVGEKSNVEIPPTLINEELGKMKEEFTQQVGATGLTFEKYLEHIKKTEEEMLEGWRSRARDRVKAALVLRAIGEEERITPSDEEIEKRTKSYLARYANISEAEKREGSPEELSARIKAMIRNEKVMDIINTGL